jgi:hypothetical protein
MFDSHPDMAYESSFISTLVRQRRRYERSDGFDQSRFLADLTTHSPSTPSTPRCPR